MSERDFYDLMRNGQYSKAYDFLLQNPGIVRDMKVSELAEHYGNFSRVVPGAEMHCIGKVVLDEIAGKDRFSVMD